MMGALRERLLVLFSGGAACFSTVGRVGARGGRVGGREGAVGGAWAGGARGVDLGQFWTWTSSFGLFGGVFAFLLVVCV